MIELYNKKILFIGWWRRYGVQRVVQDFKF